MSIATSREEREQAQAKLAEKSDEQLQADLAYWAVATADHEDRWNELANDRFKVAELHQEAKAWLGLVTSELQKRRPKPASRSGLS